jgi:hypothetical protein
MSKYIYLDESVFRKPKDYVGYGAFAADKPISDLYIKEALASLAADPDINHPRTQHLDRRTLKRQWFHATDDSKNAHSPFCRSLKKHISGHFSCNFFDLLKRRSPTGKEEAWRLGAKLSTITHIRTRGPVSIVFEERSNLTVKSLKVWWSSLEEECLLTAYDYPLIPLFFPKVQFAVEGKSHPGLQAVDFLLWAANRKVNGNPDWFSRIKSPVSITMQEANGAWGGASLDLNGGCRDAESFYLYQGSLPESVSPNLLLNFLIYAQRVINFYHRHGVPDDYSHLRDDIAHAYCDRKDPTRDAVFQICRTYLKLFDTLSVINENTVPVDKESLFLSKKYLGLVLRRDLIHGVTVADHLCLWRNEIIARAPHLLDKDA